MARIAHWTRQLAPRPEALVQSIEARRGGKLLNIDRLLLWSEPLSRAWNSFMGSVRGKLSINERCRELAICTAALIAGADYEYRFHAPLYVNARGSRALPEALERQAAKREVHGDEIQSATDQERAIMEYSAQLTSTARVGDRVFDHLRRHFDEIQLVELTLIVGAYNMSARLLPIPMSSNLSRHAPVH